MKHEDAASEYAERFAETTKVELTDPYIGYAQKHAMRCLLCGHEFIATPRTRLQMFRNRGTIGCPSCLGKVKQEKHDESRQANLQTFTNLGLKILTEDYDGRRVYTVYLIHIQDKSFIQNPIIF